ncbi:hypothetical protein QAD02_017689 [Eretmocerus hayati]|uniref:Uncharacterized protein n=1 Tax=Eretmocerus hayati TaxID=131215 RepID=A0ACC2PHJ9_9HYME|nr:hypothetical protein QAD02_017689 [Eretmocerus hayati]
MASLGKFMHWSAVILMWVTIFPINSQTQLVLDAHIYQKVVEAVHTIFNNTCVIFMYTVERPMQALDLHDAEQLMSIPNFISKLHVRAFAYAIKTFKEQIGESYVTLKRPLFVLINDSEELRQQYSTLISPWIDMAYINWVIFFREDTRIEDFFADIHVPLDCVFLIVQKEKDSENYALFDVYRIDRDRELIIGRFGSWNEDTGLKITPLAMYQRRGNLQGQLIKVGTVHDPPLSMIERNETGVMVRIQGFFGTVIQILQENLNCSITYAESQSWGSKQEDGTWTGIIGMLVRKEIDLAAAELLMTSDRLDAVLFTTPVFSTKCRAFIRRPYFTAIKWTAYSDPFYSGIWISIFTLIILSSSFIYLGMKTSPKRKKFSRDEVHPELNETFFYIFGALCGQGHDFVTIDSIRMVSLVIHITGVVVLAAYSAALISFLAIKVFVMPFTSMRGLLDDGSYKFGVVRDSADYSFFPNSSDEILYRMFEEILDEPENLPNNYFEGLTSVCTKENYAFMTMDNMFAILEHQVPCILEPLDTIMQTTMAMATPQRSPYRGLINSNILSLRDNGVLQRVIAHELLIQSQKAKDHWTSVEIYDVLPLVLLILGGAGCAILFMLFEKLHHSKWAKKLRTASLRQILIK